MLCYTLKASSKLSNFLSKSFQISSGLLMIIGASTCVVGVVYVGIYVTLTNMIAIFQCEDGKQKNVLYCCKTCAWYSTCTCIWREKLHRGYDNCTGVMIIAQGL